jgi:hypothetical protein
MLTHLVTEETMDVPHAKRLTDGDRETAAVRLREAYIQGVLTHDELDTRIEAAFRASSTDDMAQILDDIPVLAIMPEPIRLAVSNGHVERMGMWRVPGHIVLELNHATATLDFRTPVLPNGGVRLAVQAAHSRVVILVSSGARVSCENLGRHRSRISDRSHTAKLELPIEAAIQLFGDLRSSSLRILRPRYGLFRR